MIAFSAVAIADPDTGHLSANRTVLVSEGKIVKVAPADEINLAESARIIAGQGRTLLPGLADMHVHISPAGPSDDLDEEEAYARARQYLLAFLASGVTTIRNMAGTPFHLKLREGAAAGRIVSPRILSCGPILESRFTFPAMAEFGEEVQTVEAARAAVIRHHDAGYDFIKVYNDIDAEIYDAIVETARQLGIPVVGHVAFQKGLDGALAARQDSIEHLRSYDFAADTRIGDVPWERYTGWLYTTAQRIGELAERTAEAGVWNTPTMAVDRYILTDAELKEPREPLPDYLPDWLQHELNSNMLESIFPNAQREILRQGRGARAAMVKALDDIGAGLLAGTDCPGCRLAPGRSILQEIELFVGAGISPARAIRAATTSAMRFLGEEEHGRIAPGQRADLLLVDGNPFEDISALHRQVGVMTGGRWYAAADIQRMVLAA